MCGVDLHRLYATGLIHQLWDLQQGVPYYITNVVHIRDPDGTRPLARLHRCVHDSSIWVYLPRRYRCCFGEDQVRRIREGFFRHTLVYRGFTSLGDPHITLNLSLL